MAGAPELLPRLTAQDKRVLAACPTYAQGIKNGMLGAQGITDRVKPLSLAEVEATLRGLEVFGLVRGVYVKARTLGGSRMAWSRTILGDNEL